MPGRGGPRGKRQPALRAGAHDIEANGSFGVRLRAARLALGARRGVMMSQEEFAALASAHLDDALHQTRLSRLEADRAQPTIREALALAVAAEVSVTWLAYGIAVDLIVDGDPQRDYGALHAAEAAALAETLSAPEAPKAPGAPEAPAETSTRRDRVGGRASSRGSRHPP